MFRVDERGDAAGFLRLGNNMQRNGGFAGRFRPENFNNPPPGNTAHAQRFVQRQAPGVNHGDILRDGFRPHLDHGAFAELLIQVRQRVLKRLQLFFLNVRNLNGFLGFRRFSCCHFVSSFHSLRLITRR